MSDPQNTTPDGVQIVEDLPSALARLVAEARQAREKAVVVERKSPRVVRLGVAR